MFPHRRFVPIVVVFGVVPASVWPAPAAASRWVATPVARPLVPDGQLLAVSCPTTTFCAALPTRPDGNVPTAATWNGGAWTAIPAPAFIPTGMSCATASHCNAVATTTSEVDVCNGLAWATEPAAAGTQGLTSISCDRESTCTAAGTLTDATPVMERTA